MSTTKTVLCPRCEIHMYRPYGSPVPQGAASDSFIFPPALSRMDNESLICSQCGTDEAMRDMQGLAPIPPSEWPIRRSAEFGYGTHTAKPVDE